jgi:hypothetical protein
MLIVRRSGSFDAVLGSRPIGRTSRRAAFSLLELEVALVVFGIALAGLAPHAVMHIKHLRRLESRFSPETQYFLVPSLDRWARKLGAAASLTTIDPGTVTPAPEGIAVNEVLVTSIEKSITDQQVTAHVTVQAAP